jgi:hypothetical protein
MSCAKCDGPVKSVEAISKNWIRVQGKALGGEKAQHTRSM